VKRFGRRDFFVVVAALAVAAVIAPYSYLFRSPIRRQPMAFLLSETMRPAPTHVFRNNITEHVVIISIDGLRADAIDRFSPTFMRRLARDGAASFTAQTIQPSQTLPSHTSMLTGTEPDVHGITWNSDQTLVRGQELPVPTIFGIVRQHGLTTAAFFSKSKFHHLEVARDLNYSQSPNGGWGKILAFRTAEDVERILAHSKPNLMFVHLGEPDYTGHFIGWMTGAYGAAIDAADKAVGRILGAADRSFGRGKYVVILTADHGGLGRAHLKVDPVNRTIPWVAWGQGVAPSVTLPVGIRTMDTAATALWLLGIPIPSHMVGRAVSDAFLVNRRLSDSVVR
jgi:arylsulfatase A-like enzyme